MKMDRVDKVMLKAGYNFHITRYEGRVVHGYILEIDYHKRWHGIQRANSVEIHCDKNVKVFHNVINYHKLEKIERERICKIYREIYPKDRAIKDRLIMKVKKGGEYAPNLMELQRNHKTPIVSHENYLLLIASKIKKLIHSL